MRRFGFILFVVLTAFSALGSDHGIPPSVIMNLGAVSPEAHIALAEPDVNSWLLEDEMNRDKGIPFRIGSVRYLPENAIDQAESVIDDDYGLVTRLAVHSPGAIELKLHLESVNLPGDSELFIYADGEIEAERFTQHDIYPDSTFWSPGSPGSTIIIEWHWDDAPNTELPMPFELKEISHIYKDVHEIMGREGNCHNDATCDTGYRSQRDASAYIEFVDSGETYLCSGVMLNNTSQSFVPYFLTANHCIGRQAVANTIKVWFFFHTQTCNGPRPNKGFRTAQSSTLLATGAASSGSGSDYALLRLEDSGADYTGVYFAGWDRNDLTNGTAITGIHHPGGAYKRISYGSVTSLWYSGQWGVKWNRTSNPGVTEQGSSGSALFRDSNHLVVGQLWAGSSACNNQNGQDFYGRFGKSFTHGDLGRWLGNAMTCQGAYYGAGQTPTATPTSTPTPRPSNTPVPTQTPIPTNTPIPTKTTTPATQTPVPTWTPTPGTQTPAPTRTPTMTPTRTPTIPSPTPSAQPPTGTPEPPTSTPDIPTPTTPPEVPTPTPTTSPTLDLTLSILMPSRMFYPGDRYECAIIIDNETGVELADLPLFLILDVYGELYFMPDANDFSFYSMVFHPGQTILKAVPMFKWPDDAGSASNIIWYAGITDHAFLKLISNVDIAIFGWES